MTIPLAVPRRFGVGKTNNNAAAMMSVAALSLLLLQSLTSAHAETVPRHAPRALRTPTRRLALSSSSSSTATVARSGRSSNTTASSNLYGLTLINALTQTKVVDLMNGTIVDVDSIAGMTMPSFNIHATTYDEYSNDTLNHTSRVQSVRFGHNEHASVRLENHSWFTLCGGGTGAHQVTLVASCGPRLGWGTHTVTATPYTGRFGTGTAGVPLTVTFSIVSSSSSMDDESNEDLTEDDDDDDDTDETTVPSVSPASLRSATLPTAVAATSLAPTSSGTVLHSSSPEWWFDVKALSATTVNVTSDPASVTLQVTVRPRHDDDTSDDVRMTSTRVVVSLQASSPEYSADQSECTVPQAPFATDGTTGKFDMCNITLKFRRFIPQSNYSLILRVETIDDSSSSSSEEFLDDTMMIEVINANVDTVPPVVWNIWNTTALTVNVNTGRLPSPSAAQVDMTVVIQDDLSGVESAQLSLVDPQGGSLVSSDIDNSILQQHQLDSNNGVGNGTLTLNFSLPMASQMKPGNYSLALFLADNVGNSISLLGRDLVKHQLPKTTPTLTKRVPLVIEVINAAFDDVNPILLDVTVLDNALTVNVTLAPASVVIQLVARDTKSGIKRGQVTLLSVPAAGETDDDVRSIASDSFYLDEPVANQDVTVNLTLVIPQYIALGRYTLSVSVEDAYQNEIHPTSSSSRFIRTGRTIPSIEVIDSILDDQPPTLNSFVVTTPSITVNAASSAESNVVTLYALVQDDTSGIASASLTAETLGGGSVLEVRSSTILNVEDRPAVGLPLKIEFSISMDQTTRRGNYTLSLWLQDFADNLVVYDSDELRKLGFPNVLEVINPDYDGTPPSLVDFRLRSGAKADVSLSSVVAELQVVAIDNVSGVKNGTVVLVDADFNAISETVFINDVRTADAVATSFNTSLIVPRYLKSGNYHFNLRMFDFAGNQAFATLETPQGTPYFMEVVNSAIEDLTPPELLNFTALSPLTVDISSGSAVIVTFEVVAQDALSGLQSGVVMIYGPNDNDDFYASNKTSFSSPLSGEALAFNVSVTFEPSFALGSYSIFVDLTDVTGQRSAWSPNDLINKGFPGRVRLL